MKKFMILGALVTQQEMDENGMLSGAVEVGDLVAGDDGVIRFRTKLPPQPPVVDPTDTPSVDEPTRDSTS